MSSRPRPIDGSSTGGTIIPILEGPYMGRGLASFLIAVALVVGMVDCGKLAPSYIHTVAGTAGGSVTTPD